MLVDLLGAVDIICSLVQSIKIYAPLMPWNRPRHLLTYPYVLTLLYLSNSCRISAFTVNAALLNNKGPYILYY